MTPRRQEVPSLCALNDLFLFRLIQNYRENDRSVYDNFFSPSSAEGQAFCHGKLRVGQLWSSLQAACYCNNQEGQPLDLSSFNTKQLGQAPSCFFGQTNGQTNGDGPCCLALTHGGRNCLLPQCPVRQEYSMREPAITSSTGVTTAKICFGHTKPIGHLPR